jgi:uncharacterized caspase-like protein
MKIAPVLLALSVLSGCVYTLEKPPRETWKSELQSKSGSASGIDRFVKGDVDELPTLTVKERQNAYAVVIGIEDYRERLPRADYATHDARVMAEYLTKVLGYPEKNVVVRLNEKAGKADLEKYFGPWLYNNVEKGGSALVYYSGHGASNPKNGEAYLVPYDGDPTFVETTAYPVKKLYEDLEKLPTKDVVVLLDSCFSGAGGRSVSAKGSKPLIVSIESALLPTSKIKVLTASMGNQISMAYEEKSHGLFTYYVLKALQEGGYTDKDGGLKLKDLFEYIKPHVERVARKQYNTEQSPLLVLPTN